MSCADGTAASQCDNNEQLQGQSSALFALPPSSPSVGVSTACRVHLLSRSTACAVLLASAKLSTTVNVIHLNQGPDSAAKWRALTACTELHIPRCPADASSAAIPSPATGTSGATARVPSPQLHFAPRHGRCASCAGRSPCPASARCCGAYVLTRRRDPPHGPDQGAPAGTDGGV